MVTQDHKGEFPEPPELVLSWALSCAHPQAPSVSLGSSSSIPSQAGTAVEQLFPGGASRGTGEPLWLGLLHLGAWHLPFPRVLAQGAPAKLPLLPWRHRAPPARLCPLDTPHPGARREQRGLPRMLPPQGIPHCYDPH